MTQPSETLPNAASVGDAAASVRWSPWRAVVGFGVVSLAADMVYEGARSITGPLLASLGATAVLVGFITGAGEAMALVLRVVPVHWAGWAVAPALLVGGLGGGLVISPNITMALRDVPVEMAGSAGGALQTGQRVGAAIGTATLPGLFYLVLRSTGNDFRTGVAVALAAAAVGVVDFAGVQHRPQEAGPRPPVPQRQVQLGGGAGAPRATSPTARSA